MNDGTTPTPGPVVMPDNGVTPPVDGGMGAPAMDPPVVPASDGGMGDDAPVADPATPPVDGGDMGAPEMPAAPADGEAAPVDDVPAPM